MHLLFFSVLLSVSSSSVSNNNSVFIFINESKSWCEARGHCRQHHTDLASASDPSDVERLRAAAGGSEAWIGLYNQTRNRTWAWSWPGAEFDETEVGEKWKGKEPNDNGGPENCVAIDKKLKWFDAGCDAPRSFICYNESSANYEVVTDRKSWLEALKHCREKHTDLISGLDHINKIDQSTLSQRASSEWWIGLFRDTWGWSDRSNSSFRNWHETEKILDKEYKASDKACAKQDDQGKWRSEDCGKLLPFICHDNHFILVEEKLTWEQARYHCRRHHRDLAWITDEHLDRGVRARAGMAPGGDDVVWVGLLHICFVEDWVWVTGDYVSEQDERWRDPGHNDCGDAGAMETGGENKWVKKSSEETHYFICATRC